MQPAIKMALRVARQGSDYLKAHFERQEPSERDEAERRRQLDRVEQSLYDNFAEQLQKAYKDHVIAPLNDADAGANDKTWHIFAVLGRENFLRGIPEFALALVQKKANRTENVLLVNPITGEEYSASRGHGAALNSRRIRTGTAAQKRRQQLQATCWTRHAAPTTRCCGVKWPLYWHNNPACSAPAAAYPWTLRGWPQASSTRRSFSVPRPKI